MSSYVSVRMRIPRATVEQLDGLVNDVPRGRRKPSRAAVVRAALIKGIDHYKADPGALTEVVDGDPIHHGGSKARPGAAP